MYLLIAAMLFVSSVALAKAETITGHVVDGKDQPIAGATVTVFHPKIGPQDRLTVTTGADGGFSVDVTDGDKGRTNFIVDAKGFGVGGGFVYQTSTVKFVLASESHIDGNVVDEANKPVAGATVRIASVQLDQHSYLYLPADDIADRFTAKTDGSGHYTIGDLPAGATATVQIDDPKYAFADDRVALPGTPGVLIAVPAATITGRVMHLDGTPVAGIRVFTMRSDRREGFANATTGADGSYTLASLAAASYDVNIQNKGIDAGDDADEWVTTGLKGVEVIKGKTTVAPDLVMTHGALITGSVTDADTGAPIPKATVLAQIAGDYSGSLVAETDIQGSFSLRVSPGTVSVSVGAAGDYITPRQEVKPITVAEGDTPTVSFKLKLGTGFTATVADDSGKPVTGVQLWLDVKDRGGDWSSYRGPTEVEPRQTGDLEVQGVSPGTYLLTASDGWKVKSPGSITLPTVGPVAVVLQALPASSLTGRVVDTDGQAIPGAQLGVNIQYNIGSNGSSTARFEQINADASGKFEIDGLTSDDTYVNVTVSKTGYKLVSGGNVTGKDGDFTIVTPVLAPINGALIGLVRDSSGAPASGAWVVVAGQGPDSPVQTDKTGHFSVTGLTDGPAEIYAAFKSEAANKTITIASSTHAVLSLDDAGLPAAPGDLDLAEKVLDEEIAAAVGSQNFDNKSWILADLGAYSPDIALGAMTADQAADDTGIEEIIEDRAVIDPIDAANWALAHSSAINDATNRAIAEINAGLAVVEYRPALALQLYNEAKPSISAHGNQQWGGVALMSQAALAAALKLPETDKIVDQALAVDRADDAAHHYSTESELPGYLARGDVRLAKKFADSLPASEQGKAYEKILANCGYGGPEAAETAFQMITPDPSHWWSDENTMAAMAQSVRILGTRYPDDLQRIARLYAGSQAGALIMLDAADAAPMPDAVALYKEAFEESIDPETQQCSPSMVAAHAWDRDKAVGADLFAKALARVPAGYATGMIPPNEADFAFYYARVDAAFSRTMIERRWVVDARASNPSSFYMRGDAIAMAAIDPHRALEMAHAIPGEDDRIDGMHLIAQYVMAPQQTRDLIPFDVWSGGEIQIPNAMPTMW
jgi:hypothetical protein